MSKKLSTRITAVVAATCIFATTVLLCGCFDIHGEKEHKYIIEYMDAIPVTCTEYKLAEPDDSKYSLYIGNVKIKNPNTIIVNGKEKKIEIKRNAYKSYSIIIESETVKINEEFMAKKSAEYVTISEMWYRYADDMENYEDNMPDYTVCIFDNNVFIATDFNRGGGAWHFRYGGSIPACLFKYDIESDTVLYAGYLMRDGMYGAFQIEKTEQE